jgi:flagellar protein FlaF
MSLRAYQQTATRTENPREMEYRLFGQVTRALMVASEAPADDIATRIDALDWNRRVWSALATDCSLPENILPVQSCAPASFRSASGSAVTPARSCARRRISSL